MKIGLDFDGVISDCGKLKSDAAMTLYGLDIPPEKFKKEIVVDEEKLLTIDQYNTLQRTIYATREVGLLMEPVPDMLESISQLRESGHTISVVTSRGPVELAIAEEWSEALSLVIDFVGVGGGVSKAEACAGLDVYIDDDLDKLKPLVGIVPHRFLFSWGYNSGVETSTIAERVSSWKEFQETIAGL